MPELNVFLQPLNAPISQNNITSSYDFDSTIERDSVNFSHIKNFNFNSGVGGTLTLGGLLNGNGELIIKNNSGSVMIVGNASGLIGYDGGGTAASNRKFWLDTVDLSVYDGSVNIYDVNGDAAVDIRGINSLNGFTNTQSVATSLNQEFTGTTETSVTGGTLSLVAARSSNIEFIYTATGNLSGTSAGLNGYIALFIDGTERFGTRVHLNSSSLETGANHLVFTAPSSGTYSAVLKGVLNNGPGTMNLYGFNFSYIKLGN